MHELDIRILITRDLEVSDRGLLVWNASSTRERWAGPFLGSSLDAIVLGDC